MQKSSRILSAALLWLLCVRSSGVVAGDLVQEDTLAIPQASHDLDSWRPTMPGRVLAKLIEREGDKAIIQVGKESEVITRNEGVRSSIGVPLIQMPQIDVRTDTVDDKVRRFRREGLPVAPLWRTESAAINVGLNTKGKPGLWFVKKIW